MRKYCEKCKVYVDECMENCPLCGTYLPCEEDEKKDTDIISYIDHGYPKVNNEKVIRNLLCKITVLLSLIAIGVVLVVDLLATKHIDWSLHVVVGIIIFWFTLGRSLFFNLELRRQLVWDCIMASLLLIYVEWVTDATYAWAWRFGVPSVILGCLLAICITMILKYDYWEHYCLPATVLCILSAVPMIYYVCMYHTTYFMHYICLGAGLALWIAMMVIEPKKYFLEVRKKFHI